MRVVSFVPSWTETLLECGVEVVGRTRFCVHPEATKAIPVVGGTKDVRPETLADLKPDFVLLDREENPKWMGDFPWWVHATHIENTDDVVTELNQLGALLAKPRLVALAEEWKAVLERPKFPQKRIEDLPGVLEWIRRPEAEPEVLVYLVWRGPWMAVSRNTFIGSVLTHLGYGGRLQNFAEKYPKVDLAQFDPSKTLLLFSSEPYPFGKKIQKLKGLNFPAALVDGEAYSWFGVRSLRFLQSQK